MLFRMFKKYRLNCYEHYFSLFRVICFHLPWPKYIGVERLDYIFSNPLPFFKDLVVCHFQVEFGMLFTCTVCKFFVREMFWQYFLPVCGFHIHLLHGLLISTLMKVKLSDFFFFCGYCFLDPI